MADQVKDFEDLARRLEAMDLPQQPAAVSAAGVDICGVWKTVKPFVETGIGVLRLLPFGWARKLADALETLAKALNALCP